MLAIASGILKGLRLQSPKGEQTRPTGERLRQAMFNVVSHYFQDHFSHLSQNGREGGFLNGAKVADFFAGSGALGLEALSHGAQNIYFVENHPLALDCVRENIRRCLVSLRSQTEKQSVGQPQISLIKKDVLEGLAQVPHGLDLIFFDAPYSKGYLPKLLQSPGFAEKLRDGGLFVVELAEKEMDSFDNHFNQLVDSVGLKLWQTKNYGDSTVYYYVKTTGHGYIKDGYQKSHLSGDL